MNIQDKTLLFLKLFSLKLHFTMKKQTEFIKDAKAMIFALIFLAYCSYWCFFGAFTVDYLVRYTGSFGTVGIISLSILCMMILYYFLQPTLSPEDE